MFSYKKFDCVEEILSIAAFSFGIKQEKQEKFRNYLDSLLKSNVELYGVFDEERLIAGYLLYPFEMRFREDIVPMGGIGLVCSRPDYRGKGAVKFMLKNAIKTMVQKDMMVSVLYPFNIDFYRKYGWEIFFTRKIITLSPGQLKKSSIEGIKAAYLDYADEETRNYYNERVKTYYNFALRDDYIWYRHLDNEISGSASEGVVKFVKNGKVVGIFTLQISSEDFGSKASIGSMIYDSEDVKRAMFDYLRKLSHQVSKMELWVSDDFLIWPYLSDRPSDIKKRYAGMIRINSMNLLNELKIGNEDIDFTVSIKDKTNEENEGTWKLTNNEGTLLVTKSSEKPDLETDIGTFSSIMSGFTDFNEMITADRVKVINKDSKFNLKKITTFHFEHF
ncbi:MAG: GNAT family N-acetyltransferase [Kosmotoga sp.]|nr:MAG: GNAT family N-acetyltransferase [Kosmotoga sp.]